MSDLASQHKVLEITHPSERERKREESSLCAENNIYCNENVRLGLSFDQVAQQSPTEIITLDKPLSKPDLLNKNDTVHKRYVT